MQITGRRIDIGGVVQGVGFRPFVYNLARRHGLCGWVCNTSAGVEVEVEGPRADLDAFICALAAEAPPLARIDRLDTREIPANGYLGFEIRHSIPLPGQFQPISPDICICDDCLRELFDPSDRRYRYPFINCTNCGPRFTIIQDIPYDRPSTTMRPFVMCAACQAEYDDPANRRFHAQPNACPECGPQVRLIAGARGTSRDPASLVGDEAIREARRLLAHGAIVAVKGLGGFHLACDAAADDALRRLRERKGRVDKPFALMAFDLATVERLCFVDGDERRLLESRERPVVLLRRRTDCPVSLIVAPGNQALGVMLPYSPLHYLLLEGSNALVMTSGNVAEEPIATGNAEALARLPDLADAFLVHDRDIYARCDDSVVRVFRGAELPIRRSRGYAPYPVRLPFEVRPTLAVGAELKNTFCLARDRYAFLSQHIGDMENLETLQSFEQMAGHFERLFRIEPQIIAHDLHPDYLSTQYALEHSNGLTFKRSNVQTLPVQHHHAHIAACMAENGLVGDRPVLGIAFDGTGYGTDGAIWGGEFLVADYAGFRRAAHLAYVPLPGGDAAIRRPARTALAHLWRAFGTLDLDLPPVWAVSAEERRVVRRQLEHGVNAPPTSSAGRLFDAVAAIAGVRQAVNYEAQAAIELENLAAVAGPDPALPAHYAWPFPAAGPEIDPAPIIRAVVADVRAGAPVPVIAARFHAALAGLVRDGCVRLRVETGLSEVALSGGVWQNVTLLAATVDRLAAAGFVVYTHRLVPPNDGGISLGQAVIGGVVCA